MTNRRSSSEVTQAEAPPSGEITSEDVTKQFHGESRAAVDHVSLRIEAGNLVVLLGPSGCGKTTLLKMVNRLYEPTAGRIWIDQVEVRDLPVTELRRRIGYVIQQVGLFPHMRIAQNISVVPRLLGWERERIDARVAYLVEMVDLPPAYLRRYPRQLSGGEQQRIGLARALAADPAILLMDEPFAAIDAITRASLQGELLEIQRRVRKTMVFVTHDVEEAFRLADKIAVLKEGRLIQYGTPLEIVTRPQNQFVQDLVGTQNMLRRLSLLTVRAVLEARTSWASEHFISDLGPPPPAAVHLQDDLRSVLSCLLDNGAQALPVVDPSGRAVGEITFTDLRAALIAHAPKVREPSRDELPNHSL
jgi:osmoprotectant transport system ATP-binding protein